MSHLIQRAPPACAPVWQHLTLMRAIVIGAGIGGCVAALALQQKGIEVTVYESVREIAPLGVGINLLPHAMRVLADLDLINELLPLGVQTAELAFFNRHGQLIWREPRGVAAGYDVPQLSVHRGKLQLALVAAVRQRVEEGNLRTAHALTSFTVGSPDERPTVTLEHRITGETVTDSADVVVACDGIHSLIRQSFNPSEGPPHWSGNVLWRAATQHAGFLTKRSMFMAGHLPQKFVAYPISEPDSNGLQAINWIAELNREAEGLSGREGWNKRVDKSLFADRFADWTFEWLDIPGLIEQTQDVFEFPMVDRDPIDTWTYGYVTLLGDAAHPMYPIGSNGASQAILDAAALAAALVEYDDPAVGLRAYEATRRPATAKIVLSNRAHGPERVLDLAEQRSPEGFASVSEVFATGELEDISALYKQLAGFSRPRSPD
jgi:5-methylphenazine-1-carboxylate 1-monooxygenase